MNTQDRLFDHPHNITVGTARIICTSNLAPHKWALPGGKITDNKHLATTVAVNIDFKYPLKK